jgi:hypothetical protein
MLKNVGLICDACGAGRHYDCIVLTDESKHMCLCNYTCHPYLSREQLSKPLSIVTPLPLAGEQHGKEVYQRSDTPSRLADAVRQEAPRA